MTDAGTAQAAPSEPEQRITAVPVKGSDQSNADGLPRTCPPAPHLARVPKGARSGSLGAAALPPRLAWYDVPALIEEALAMPDACGSSSCAAPTVHLLAHLLREATETSPAALPPDAHADVALIREALNGRPLAHTFTTLRQRDDALAALERLVAALPDTPAEPERKPNWVQCARCYHVWDDADDDHEVCPCLHEHGSRQVWPLTTVEVAALANTSTNLRPDAPAETHTAPGTQR